MSTQISGSGVITPTLDLTTPLAQADGGSGVSVSRQLAQIVTYQTGAVVSGGTAIPYDDTIPQNTEGYLLMTAPSITPTNVNSTIEVEVVAHLSVPNSAINVTTTLISGSTANAVAVAQDQISNSTAIQPQIIKYSYTAGSTAAVIFTVRAGTAAANVITMNGASGARLMGGALISSITIKEYLP